MPIHKLSRRAVITAGIGGIGAGATTFLLATPGAAAASATTVTLWQLDPDWGTPRTTDSGSDTKTRCRGRACHLAAPHRYFLTSADAVAGRLHPCCLAQPTPVEVCIDLNALMPYYRARLGGVDDRCPELPEPLRQALAAGACAVPSTTTTTPTSTTTTTSPATTTVPPATPTTTPGGGVEAAGAEGAPRPGGSVPGSLPFTGTSVSTAFAAGLTAAAVGAAAVAAAERRDAE